MRSHGAPGGYVVLLSVVVLFLATHCLARDPRTHVTVPEEAEIVRPGAWPGTAIRAPGILPGAPRKGCIDCEGLEDRLHSYDLVFASLPRDNTLVATAEAADRASLLADIELALIDEEAYVCAGILKYGEQTGSRFLFTRSYLSVDELCTNAAQSPCYTSEELLSASNDGFYTRVALDLKLSGVAPFRGSTGTPTGDQAAPFGFEVKFVASQGAENSSQGTCATYSSNCPSGSSCQGWGPVRVDTVVRNVRAVASMVRDCPSSAGNDPHGAGMGSCGFPFAYPVFTDDTDADAAAADDCSSDVLCDRTDGLSCTTSACTPPAAYDTATAANLDALCGSMRDPDQGLLPELNERCAKAVCGACAAAGSASAAHRAYAAGPVASSYHVPKFDHFLADIELLITVVLDENLGITSTRTVKMENVDLNAVVMNEEGDQTVRATVLGILADAQMNLPDLSSGRIVTYDYSDSPSGYIRMGPVAGVNYWQDKPNRGAGEVPTATYLGDSGWYYLAKSGRFGGTPGAYGESQYTMTSPLANFGSKNSCFGGTPAGEFYAECRGIPGCDLGRGGVPGDEPQVTTACRASHILNTAASELQAGVHPSALTYGSGVIPLPPTWDFLRPNYVIYDDKIYYFLPDGGVGSDISAPGFYYEESTFVPSRNIFLNGTAVGASSFVTDPSSSLADYILSSSELQLREAYGSALSTTVTIALDISQDFAPYRGASNSVAILSAGTGCAYVLEEDDSGLYDVPGEGFATVTIQNLGEEGAVTYTVTADCESSDEDLIDQPYALEPVAGYTFTVLPDSAGQSPLFEFRVAAGTELASYGDHGSLSIPKNTLRCTFSVTLINSDQVLASAPASCLRWGTAADPTPTPQPTGAGCDADDPTCYLYQASPGDDGIDGAQWFWVAIAGVALLAIAGLAVAGVVVALVNRKKT